MYDFTQDMESILLDKEALDSVISELAARINHDYGDSQKPLVAIPVLKGAVFFATALLVISHPKSFCFVAT